MLEFCLDEVVDKGEFIVDPLQMFLLWIWGDSD